MPNFEQQAKPAKPMQVSLHGYASRSGVAHGATAATANILSRQLCILPGNKLSAATLIEQAANVAKLHGLEHEHIDLKQLRKLNANLFLAVTGTQPHGGLVRLSYRSGRKNAKKVSILGKGVCFDTGGLNIKPHRHMLGMQGDMAGAAAALSAIIACKHLKLRVDVDAWLAVAENLVEATSMRPGDIVTAHNGKSVEIVHTDAEGRMLLADSLSILAKDKPDMVVTLATLTGSMITAAGNHMSGVTGDPALVKQACTVGDACGERLFPFPLPKDYEVFLESEIADILQCSANDEPDHILAGLFLQEFTHGIPWLHLDLSASACKGGLGAVPTEQTGFGAAWLVNWLEHVAKQR
jgi:leucyl aminopeptidase